jgi:hypothetical protein
LKPTPTRTLNPLPFGDLEPHRFEDLVRQLAYDLRRWKSLEATGRGGTDSGMDIRAIELYSMPQEVADEEEEGEETFLERTWVFQCKREKALPPKRIRKVVEESLKSFATPPYGFVLAAACDVSKEARDAFREEMVSRQIEEFHIWAKGELEDLLFQPKNDRLLFAYFGIALQPRRRSLTTELRSEITKKKQIAALIGDEERQDGKLMLLRDPSDDRYPNRPKPNELPPRWILCRAVSVRKPGHLIVRTHEYLAAVTADGKQWDAILGYDALMNTAESELQSADAWNRDDWNSRNNSAHSFWLEYIEESQRVFLKVHRAIPLERILALDPLGDGFHPVPHILVDFSNKTDPFTAEKYAQLQRGNDGIIDIRPDDDTRTRIFPDPLPAEDEPEPAGFDDTGKPAVLANETDAKLSSLLTTIGAARTDTGKEKYGAEADDSPEEKARQKMSAFQEWRKNVARPVFSAFVDRLRKAGHRARVVVRSVQAGTAEEYREAFEKIELKFRLRTSNGYNPSGHLLISCSQHMTLWRTDTWPSAKDSRGAYNSSSDPIKVDSSTTKEQLETIVLRVIERLSAELR